MWALSNFDLYFNKYFNQVLQFLKSMLDGISSPAIRWQHLDFTTYILAFIITHILLKYVTQYIRSTVLKAVMRSCDVSTYEAYRAFDVIAFSLWSYKCLFTCSADTVKYPALGAAVSSNAYVISLLIGGLIYCCYQGLKKHQDIQRRRKSGIPIAENEKPAEIYINLLILAFISYRIIFNYNLGVLLQIAVSALSNFVIHKLLVY